MNKAVFLDRDGVLNRNVVVNGKPFAPTSLDRLEILDGVREALLAFRAAGFRTLVCTNQPDVATGRQSRAQLEAIHGVLRSQLALDDIFVCCHTDDHACSCRKPQPGMLLEAGRKWSVDLAASYMVGDRWRDVEAGHRAGCRTVWVRYEDYAEQAPTNPHWIVGSLLEASRVLCGHARF
jgi:D-glycero-D-manno-heptose 1,7-bisphosphate phosphatase